MRPFIIAAKWLLNFNASVLAALMVYGISYSASRLYWWMVCAAYASAIASFDDRCVDDVSETKQQHTHGQKKVKRHQQQTRKNPWRKVKSRERQKYNKTFECLVLLVYCCFCFHLFISLNSFVGFPYVVCIGTVFGEL